MDLVDADRRILRVLQQDARISNQDLAKCVGLSASACWRRVKALEDAGIIAGYPAIVDPEKAGLTFSAIVQVTLSRHESTPMASFFARIEERPEVVTCFATTGEADYHLRVVCRDKDAYNEFLDEFLIKLPGVAHIRTYLILKSIKLQSAVPV